MRAVGAFIFAGGFTLGVRRAGFDVAAVLEETDYGVAVARANQPDVPVYVGRERWPLDDLPRGDDLDLLYGNPPCAAWSLASAAMTAATRATKDWRTDARVDCTRRHFSLLEELRPRAWAWESVTQAFTKGRELVDDLTIRAAALGYSATYLLHDARWLGVPQTRKRFFCLFHRFRFDLEVTSLRWEEIACGEVLRGMNDPGPPQRYHIARYEDWLHKAAPGEAPRRAWERLNPPTTRRYHKNGFVVGRPPFTIRRPHPDRPSHTIMHETVHPTEHRAMSVKELATLCGYPPDYEFPTGMGDHSLVSRGVCPPVGEWLAREIARCAARDERDVEPVVQLIDVRKPPGIVERPVGTHVWPLTAKLRRTSATEIVRMAKPRVTENTRTAMIKTVALAPEDAFAPALDEGSGSYIRYLLLAGRWSTPEIVALVHTHYAGRKTTASDVSYNANILKRQGLTFERVTRRDLIAPRPWEGVV